MNRLATLVVCLGTLSLAGCGAGLTNGIEVAACDSTVQSVINTKCTGADAVVLTCTALTKTSAKKFEKVDVDTCAANIKNAPDCTGAKGVTCAIAYTE